MNAKKLTLVMAILAVLAMSSLVLIPATGNDAAEADEVLAEEGEVKEIDYKETEVTGEYSSRNIFDETQIVTVKDYWTLTNGANVEVFGKLVVPAGATLTIDSDANLVIYGEAQIDGTIIVKEAGEDGGLLQFGGEYDGKFYPGAATVNGTLDIEGQVDVYGNITMAQGSTAVVQDTGCLSTYNDSEMVIAAGATVTVYGLLKSLEITVQGTLTYDSEVIYNQDALGSEITLKDSGVLNVNKIVISGNTMLGIATLLVYQGEKTAAVGVGLAASPITPAGEDKNAHVEATFTGLKVAAVTKDKVAMTQVSGNVDITKEYISESTEDQPEGIYGMAAVQLSGNIIVDESLVIGENVTFSNDENLLVTGTIDARNGTFENDGSTGIIDVVGEGMIVNDVRINSETGINATRYINGDHYYVDIDAAIAQAADKSVLYVLGTQTVKAEGSAMPAGSKLDLAGAVQLVIGDGPGDTLTIAEGATITGIPSIEGNKIDVVGTLLIENQLNVPSNVKNVIAADVVIYETDADGKLVRDGWVKYTNVYTALEEAQAGETVNLKRDIVVDGADLVIPEEVTLATNAYDVTVKAPWKIIDNGTFDVDSDSAIIVGEKTDKAAASEVVINGVAKSDAPFEFITDAGNEYISEGAYYSITTKKTTTWYIEPVANAVEGVEEYDAVVINDYPTTIPGFYVRANDGMMIGDLNLEGVNTEETKQLVAMVVETDLNASNIYVDMAVVYILDGKSFSGIISNGEATATVNGTGAGDTGLMVRESYEDDYESLFVTGDILGAKTNLALSGNPIVYDLNAESVVINGDILVDDRGESGQSVITNLDVMGYLSVNPSATVEAETVNVMGNIKVVERDGATGLVMAEFMFVGVDKNGNPADFGHIDGNFEIYDYAMFKPESDIPESITEDPALSPTVFYGEGDKEVVTVYAVADTAAVNSQIKITVENAWLGGWVTEDGVPADDAAFGEYPAVYAFILYEIYHLTIVADYGVQNVAINGVIMSHSDIGNNTYYASVKAGDYKITVTLANGYTGTAKVSLVEDGKVTELTGGTLKAEGTPDSIMGIPYHLQVSGAEAATGDVVVHVDPSDPVVVIDKESDDWSISTILMLVLVIVVGLVAVVLLLRLNRS
jgi:hypothetical protein